MRWSVGSVIETMALKWVTHSRDRLFTLIATCRLPDLRLQGHKGHCSFDLYLIPVPSSLHLSKMLSLCMLHRVLTALFVAALVFNLECSAVRTIHPDNELVASSSSPSAAGSSQASTSGQLRTLDSYIKQIDPRRIGQPYLKWGYRSIHGLPYDGYTPIFNLDTDKRIVHQAIRAARYVIVVDPIHNEARLVSSEDGRILSEQ